MPEITARLSTAPTHTTTTSPAFIALQSAVAGRYSLETEIGRGGMGIVFLARDVALDRPVAIKLLPPDLAADSEFRQRFVQEARTAAGLSHPNIVPIHSVEEHGDLVFFVMTFVDGETLGQRVERQGPLRPSEAVRLIQEVAWALTLAHAKGIVHRDVKPDNILLDKATERAMVTDFGIARVAAVKGTADAAEIVGTAHYMSPEQALGEDVDARSDIYSLGITAFFALTGTVPFDAPTLPAILAKHVSEPPPPLSSVRDLPGKLAEAVDRCLLKDPTKRFQSSEELAEALAEYALRNNDVAPQLRLLLRQTTIAANTLLLIMLAILFVLLFDLSWAIVAVGIVAMLSLPVLKGAREIVRSGMGFNDLRSAVAVEVRQRGEEIEVARGSRFAMRVKSGKLHRGMMIPGVVLIAMGVFGLFSGESPAKAAFFGFLGLFTLIHALVIRRMWRRGSAQELFAATDDIVGAMLGGRLGRWLLRIGSVGLDVRLQAIQHANDPTEVVVGSAADSLFQGLPQEHRLRFEEAPDVIHRLQAHAQALRRRRNELERALAQAKVDQGSQLVSQLLDAAKALGSRTQTTLGEAGNRSKAGTTAELEVTAQTISERLSTAVGALENIRLGLLRLSTGQGSIADLAADLDAARNIGDEIDRLLAGQRDVAEMLASDHTIPR